MSALSPLDAAAPLPALSLGYSGYDGGAGGILSPVGLSALTRTRTPTLTLALTLALTPTLTPTPNPNQVGLSALLTPSGSGFCVDFGAALAAMEGGGTLALSLSLSLSLSRILPLPLPLTPTLTLTRERRPASSRVGTLTPHEP